MEFEFEPDIKGAVIESDDVDDRPKGFIRSKQDNTLFTDIQVKDLKDLVTEDCINVIDSDSLAYKTASSVEEDYIVVKHKEEGWEKEFSNVTEFKGGSRKPGTITQNSFLGSENLKREVEGKSLYEIEDFEITPCKRFVYKTEEKCLEILKDRIDEWVEAIKIQTGVDNILCVLGEGKSHRNAILLPKEYKSNRDGLARPLLLKHAREYIQQTYPTEIAKKGFEADEVVDSKGYIGYLNYCKSGKFNYIKSSIDKDARATPGILFNYDKDFHFKQPQAWLLEASNKTVGEIELVKGECKATGILQTAYQCVIGDTSDFYGSRLNMPKEMKPAQTYGDTAFYKDFAPLKTAQEVMQKAVDKFLDFYPRGVQFTAWDGTEIDADTFWWMSQVFACQYMTRSYKDKTDLKKVLDAFKVDYSSLVGNNKEPVARLVDEEKIREVIGEIRNQLFVLSNGSGMLAYKKTEKKDMLTGRLDDALCLVKDIEKSLDKFFKEE
jgi:hypothetical protein